MTAGQLDSVFQHLRRAVLRCDGAGLTDGDLLGCFVRQRDEAAFAALVQRHGPMVWGVCRRMLSNHHDAEDAFQATFLVMVRKAASLASPDLLANWLYGVACNVAYKAKAANVKRHAKERPLMDMPAPETAENASWKELRPLLDKELKNMPDKYRAPIVLCDLEGKTRKEAARLLGLPEGTLSSRLARARTMLAKRLTRRGVVFSSGPLVLLLSQNASTASVPAALASGTMKAASLMAMGEVATTSVVPAKVAYLVKEGVGAMWFSKSGCVYAAVLAAVVAGVGTGMFMGTTSAECRRGRVPSGSQHAAGREACQAIDFKWKFTTEPFYTEVTTVTEQNMNVMGMPVTQGQTNTLYLSWKLKEKNEDGSLLVEQVIEGVKIRLEIGGSTIEYNSTNPKVGAGANDALRSFYRGLVGSKSTFLFDPRNPEPLKLEYHPSFLSGLIGFPDRPVRKGDSWTKTEKTPVGPFRFSYAYRYTYVGKDANDSALDRIAVLSTITFHQLADSDGKLPFKIEQAKFKTSEAKGFVLFDNQKGRVANSELSTSVEGTMTIVIGGQPEQVSLVQSEKTTVRMFDKNPLVKPK